jgi:hypothetical protein
MQRSSTTTKPLVALPAKKPCVCVVVGAGQQQGGKQHAWCGALFRKADAQPSC